MTRLSRLNKEIKEDLKRWKYLSCSLIIKMNIVKMSILPKTICRFNAILIEILTQFYTDTERTILNLIWINIKPRLGKTNLKREYQGIPIHDLKL